MRPTPGQVHVNQPLSNISVAFIQSAANFAAGRVFPRVPVMKQSDRYYTFDRGQFNRDEMKKRAPGTESAGGGFTVDNTPTYFCDKWSLHKDLDDDTRANADSPVQLDRATTIYLTTQGLIRQEKEWVDTFFTTGVWTTDMTGVSGAPATGQVKQWNDATSDPIADVKLGKTTVLQSTGYEPNKLTIGQFVWDSLSVHPDILDRMKYMGSPGKPATVTREAVAAIFELDEIVVSKAIVNTAAEGATNAHSFIAGKKALLTYSPPEPGLMTPSAGYNFVWTGLYGGSALGTSIKTFRMDSLESERYEINMAFDMAKVSADLGYFFTSVVA